MKEILSHMAGNGLHPKDLILDGKVHRFKIDANDKKESGWLIGFQNYTRQEGAQFFVCRYGNYKTGDVFQFQSEGTFTAEDRKTIKDQIEKQKKKADDDRRKEQEVTAADAVSRWNTLETSEENLPDYLATKKIESLHGCRSYLTQWGRVLYVPMFDENGKLWNLQKIQPDRQKFFMPGGRVAGCFHVIGEIRSADTIRICEGFATGASIAQALPEQPVVVCFTANNLLSVATVLKLRYPDKTFTICGDDDIWTTRKVEGEDQPYNPGREKAEEAARKTMGVAVFPQFKILEKGATTDFNDLHVREGLDKVRDQIEGVKPTKHYIVPLGYDGGDYYLLSNINPQIQKLSASQMGTSSGLCRLQPLQYWENQYPAKNDNGVAWQRAADVLMQDCHAKGVFRPDKVRGRGVWIDNGRVIYHMGDRLFFEGQEHPLHKNALRSKYIYESSEGLPPVHASPLTTDECQFLIAASQKIRWKKADSFRFFTGWIAISYIGGALAWRPHVWITGPSGSGKSFIMQNLTFPLLAHYAHFFRGQTTEAGVRQKSGRSTQPVIFDEFETNDDRSKDRVSSILELARQASSDSDGIVAKGTTSGDAMEFRPQFSMMVGSVRLNLVYEEDQNRFAVLELDRASAGGSNEQFELLKDFIKELGPEYGRRLFARMLNMTPIIIQSAEILQRAIADKYPMRVGQQYGTLLAGHWAMISDHVITKEEAEWLRDNVDFSVVQTTIDRNDELECLEHVLQKVVKFESAQNAVYERSIREIIKMAKDDPTTYLPPLQRLGLHCDGKFLCIHKSHRSIIDMFGRSKWSSNYGDQLSRINGAKNNDPRYFSYVKKSFKCVSVPIDFIFSEQ